MAKNITSIKDLVIQFMTNGKEIESKAEKGDSESCFQMGMSHLLGINTSIDFEKAAQYFGDKSLADDPDANRLLGFIAECEGKFGEAFQYYAKTGKSTRSYLQKVYEERGNLQSYLKKLNLPDIFLNKEITAILYDYIKDGSPILPKIKIAYICEDEQTFLKEIQALVEGGDLFSAKRWLQIGNVGVENPLFATIEKKSIELMMGSNPPEKFDVIVVDGSSLVSDLEKSSSSNEIKSVCDEASKMCKKGWCEKVPPIIDSYKRAFEQEEAERKRREAERRKKEEEEERRRKKEEELKRKKEEEELRKKKEAERLREQNRRAMRVFDIFMVVGYIGFLLWFTHLFDDNGEISIPGILASHFICCIPFVFIWLVISNNIKKRFDL